jgi:hypothetical protein
VQDPTGLGGGHTWPALSTNAAVLTYRQTEQAETVAKLAGTERVTEGGADYDTGCYRTCVRLGTAISEMRNGPGRCRPPTVTTPPQGFDLADLRSRAGVWGGAPRSRASADARRLSSPDRQSPRRCERPPSIRGPRVARRE